MASTRLQRKSKRNKLKARFRKVKLKHLLEIPTLKKKREKSEKQSSTSVA